MPVTCTNRLVPTHSWFETRSVPSSPEGRTFWLTVGSVDSDDIAERSSAGGRTQSVHITEDRRSFERRRSPLEEGDSALPLELKT